MALQCISRVDCKCLCKVIGSSGKNYLREHCLPQTSHLKSLLLVCADDAHSVYDAGRIRNRWYNYITGLGRRAHPNWKLDREVEESFWCVELAIFAIMEEQVSHIHHHVEEAVEKCGGEVWGNYVSDIAASTGARFSINYCSNACSAVSSAVLKASGNRCYFAVLGSYTFRAYATYQSMDNGDQSPFVEKKKTRITECTRIQERKERRNTSLENGTKLLVTRIVSPYSESKRT